MADDKPRCHLHPKPKKSCKICQRIYGDALHVDPAAKAAEKAAAARAALAKASSSSKPTFSCSPLLKSQIIESSYYRSLLNIESLEVLAEEMQVYADSLEVYQAGSTTSPSVFFCCVYRLFTLDHLGEEMQTLLDHAESPVSRCAGLLYARFVVKPEQLWDQLEEFILDEMDLGALKSGQQGTPNTIGEYVEHLLMKDKYYGTPLPRLPVLVRRQLEERVAPLPQYRKRMASNKRELRRFRACGTPVEVNVKGEWMSGEITRLDPSRASRVRVTVELDDSKSIVTTQLGKVILREPPSDEEEAMRRRRSDSPDWTRWKGESDVKLVEALREQAREEAVCGHGKDYAKRVGRFESGLAVRREAGAAESKLIEDDTLQPMNPVKRRKTTDEEEGAKGVWRSEEEREQQRKLQQIYEKYSQSGAQASVGRKADVDTPDVMRLG